MRARRTRPAGQTGHVGHRCLRSPSHCPQRAVVAEQTVLALDEQHRARRRLGRRRHGRTISDATVNSDRAKARVAAVDDEGFELAGAVAVVTGSTRGIGKQTALALGRAGASVVVVGRTRDAQPNPVVPGTLESVHAELTAAGVDARVRRGRPHGCRRRPSRSSTARSTGTDAATCSSTTRRTRRTVRSSRFRRRGGRRDSACRSSRRCSSSRGSSAACSNAVPGGSSTSAPRRRAGSTRTCRCTR